MNVDIASRRNPELGSFAPLVSEQRVKILLGGRFSQPQADETCASRLDSSQIRVSR